MISPAPSPLPLDAYCRQISCWFDVSAYHPDQANQVGIPLPEKLDRAVDKRKAEYLSGRYCAQRALQELGFAEAPPIGTGDNRQPLWPAGVVGSITHSHGFASAVVAPDDAIKSVGIDTEFEIEVKTARNVASHILVDAENFADNDAVARSPEQYLTLVFSAKESIFKCLYPLVNKFFDFHAAQIILPADQPGVFHYRLLKPLSDDIGAGFSGQGQYAVAENFLHTAVILGH